MPVSVSDSIINAYAAGRQLRMAAEAQQRQQILDQQEADDRRLRQDVLKHQLASMKLEDRLKARDIAIQTAQAQGGQPQATYSPDQIEGGVLPASGPGMPPVSLKPTVVPGFSDPDLGVTIPDTTVRPQTMEQALASQMKQARVKALETDFTLKPGEKRFIPSETPGNVEQVASGGPEEVKFEAPQWYMMGGRKVLLRPASDGNLYPAGGTKPVDSTQVEPLPDKPTDAERNAGKDDPELPRGVQDYIASLTQQTKWVPATYDDQGNQIDAGHLSPLSFQDARDTLRSAWPDLVKSHPKLSAVKADNAIRGMFRPDPGSTSSLLQDLLGGGATPGAAASTANATVTKPAPAAAKPAAAAASSKPTAPTLQIGQRVKAKDGKWYVVGKVYADGSWDPTTAK